MKAQLLVGNNEVVGELLWPDDASADEIKDAALGALGMTWEITGNKIAPNQYVQKPVPYEVRVLNGAGEMIYRCTIADLAKVLGKELP